MSDRIELAKYQASGNDFLLVDERHGSVGELDVPALCDRWFGVGADGLIRVGSGAAAPYRFDLTNADGSSAAMSGNGMRCLAAFLRDRGAVAPDETLDVETPAGLRRVTLTPEGATVAMGVPSFAKSAIPMRGAAWETFRDEPVDLGRGLVLRGTALSMGNPHLVLFTDEDPERYHLEHLGPALETDERFPERTNVEFARVVDRSHVDVRVWERGVGETLACGTGACAVAAAANEAGLMDESITTRFRGGLLTVDRSDAGELLLGGPVAHVFDATVDPGALR